MLEFARVTDRFNHPSPDPSYFTCAINVGTRRILHTKTIKFDEEFLDRLKNRAKMTSFKFGVVLCRIRLLPILISKIKWLESGLHCISALMVSYGDHNHNHIIWSIVWTPYKKKRWFVRNLRVICDFGYKL